MGAAYAEPPEHLKDEALEDKQLWERIEQLQSKVNQTEADQTELANAQERFYEIRTLLNGYGMATPQQIAANPDYWEDYNDKDTGDGGYAATRCDCPPKVKFKSGYSYQWSWFWTAYKWSGWGSVSFANPEATKTVEVQSGQNGQIITPLGKFKLSNAESAEFTATSRIQNEDGDLVRPPQSVDIDLSGSGTLTYSYNSLPNASTGDELIIIVQLDSIE